MVMKSFKTCGISYALDGTKDDAVNDEETEGRETVDADEDELENEFDTDSKTEDEWAVIKFKRFFSEPPHL